LLNQILEYAEISETGDIAWNQADLLHNDDCQASEKESLVTGNQVSNQAGGIAGNQVSNQADLLHSAENQELEITRLIDGNQVGTIVRGIANPTSNGVNFSCCCISFLSSPGMFPETLVNHQLLQNAGIALS